MGRAGVVGYAALEEAERAAVSTSTRKRYLRGAADHWRNAIRLQRQRFVSIENALAYRTSGDLGGELLKRAVGDALRYLRLQNRAPYP
jgi:hypothetical protein